MAPASLLESGNRYAPAASARASARCAQLAPHQLPGCRSRQRIDKDEFLRNLEQRDFLAHLTCDISRQRVARLVTRPRNDVGADTLADNVIRHADDAGFEHRTVLHQRRLHFPGRDQVRAALDEIVRARGVPEIAVLVAVGEVVGVVPPVLLRRAPDLRSAAVAERQPRVVGVESRGVQFRSPALRALRRSES